MLVLKPHSKSLLQCGFQEGEPMKLEQVLSKAVYQPVNSTKPGYAIFTQPWASFQLLSCTVHEGQLKIHSQFSFTASAVRVCVLRQYLIRIGLVSSAPGLKEKLERDRVLTLSSKGRAAMADFALFFFSPHLCSCHPKHGS